MLNPPKSSSRSADVTDEARLDKLILTMLNGFSESHEYTIISFCITVMCKSFTCFFRSIEIFVGECRLTGSLRKTVSVLLRS